MKRSLYLSFLRYSLDDSQTLPSNVLDIDWMKFMAWAEEQGVVGIIYGGIQRAGKALNIPFDDLMEWVGYAQQIEGQNWSVNKQCVELVKELKQDGFNGCILKGQGVALLYPNPSLRIPGDIDIWLEGGRDKIMGYVTEKYGHLLERYHHVELPVKEDAASVEVHFTPSYMFSWRSNKRLQEWFNKHADSQFRNEVRLPNSEGTVAVPTNEFNLVFLLSHIYRHLFSEGIGLRQVIDYYYLLKSDVAMSKPDLRETLRYLRLDKFAGALMWVLHQRLGLDKQYLIAEPNEKEGRFLWNEIMIGGNFGQYDQRLGNKVGENRLTRFLRLTAKNMRNVRHYPSEALSEPLFRAWYYIWRLIHHK